MVDEVTGNRAEMRHIHSGKTPSGLGSLLEGQKQCKGNRICILSHLARSRGSTAPLYFHFFHSLLCHPPHTIKKQMVDRLFWSSDWLPGTVE